MSHYHAEAVAGTALLAFVCNDNGKQWPWLLDMRLVNEHGGVELLPASWPEHEQDGPLPAKFRHRLAGDCCGYITKSGARCGFRSRATCPYHRGAPPAPSVEDTRSESR